jgi:histidine ammonia-lyase
MLVLKVHALARGYSGVRLETLERILWHVEHDVVPVVPSQGSVGASGDLAPLSHLFLPLIGQGELDCGGEVVPAAKLLAHRGLEPLELGPKEGLGLVNGTQFIAAHAVEGLVRFQNCLDAADLVGAMSLEALLGSVRPFEAQLHELRPYAGARHVAHRLRVLLDGSQMIASHAECDRVQDPYSLRCMPQVHGASRNAWLHLKEMLAVELEAVTDNPIVVGEGEAISGGNFHGQPLALPLDYATLAASELGNISDRRTYLLVGGTEGILPKLLMRDVGINSGFMIPQYTSAALVSENKSLCFPASADSIPTSLGQEDHVSMGSISARRLLQVLGNLENILAVELLCAAQAFDFRRPLRSGAVLDACHQLVRDRIGHALEDRVFHEDLVAARAILGEGELVRRAVESARENGVDLEGDHAERFAAG